MKLTCEITCPDGTHDAFVHQKKKFGFNKN